MTFSPLGTVQSTMASLTTDTSLTQQATALAKEFGLQLMTPASVTIGEIEQIGIDLLEKIKALRQHFGTPRHRVLLTPVANRRAAQQNAVVFDGSHVNPHLAPGAVESNQSTGETKEAVVNSCPEGALRVQAGLNSFSNAVKQAKRQGIGSLLLESGVHDEEGEQVRIDFALKVIGQNKDDVKIRAGLEITGKTEEDVFLSDCTVTGAKKMGVCGLRGAAMHLKNVCVEKCGKNGVLVISTTRNTMTDCNVNNNYYSGVNVENGGCMVIDGSATTIHHNVTGGNSDFYGLHTYSSSDSIHLKSLTKESISTNNGGGGNYNDKGTIRTVDNEGTSDDDY